MELAPGLDLSQEQSQLFRRLQHWYESNQDLSFPGRTSSPGSSKWHFPSGSGSSCPAQRCFSDRQAQVVCFT